MDQRTHSWIAIRAIALLEETNSEKNLVALLKPYAQRATVGAWIPDQTDAKKGGSITECHVLKMKPYQGSQKVRFVVRKNDMLQSIGEFRKTAQFLKNDSSLDDAWWSAPYKGDVEKPGQHLPNRIMALSTMLKDLLLLGEKAIDDLIPGKVAFIENLDSAARTRSQAAAMYFFMLSHFIADVSMPCHCDARKLSAYDEGLHKELEGYWSHTVGTGFDKTHILTEDIPPDQLILNSRVVDAKFKLAFSDAKIPGINKNHDVWLEAIQLCRASFAVASIIAPYKQYAYGSETPAPFNKVLGDAHPELLESVSQTVLHDAVLNTAIIWKHLWSKVSVH